MNYLKKILIIFFFLIPSSISLAQVTYVQQAFVTEDAGSPRGHIQGIHFNTTGDRMFVIYERNQTIKSAHSAQNDNLYIAIGYLPYEGAEYAFTINGSENLLSNLEFKKNVNGLNLSFNVKDDITNLGDNREANIVLNKVF